MKVTATKNYRLFQRSADNRALVPNKHKRLIDSMKLYGFLPEFPIVVKRHGNSMIVKDGQHRLDIAETLGVPVWYTEQSCDWDVALVNSTPQNWRPLDYAQRYANQGNKHYREGIDFMEAHRLPITIAFSLLAGTTTFSNTQRAFLDGTYRVKDRAWADSVAAVYGPFAVSKHCRNARFIEACMAICRVDGFDPQRLIQSLRRCQDKLASFSTRDAYLEMLEQIYNFHRKMLFPLKNEAVMAMRARDPAAAAKKHPES